MKLKIVAVLSALMFTHLLKAQQSDTAPKLNYNILLDPSISFGPMSIALFEGALGLEWHNPSAPDQRWSVKGNYGQGDIYIIPVQDSGDWNGTAHVYYLEANYDKNLMAWYGRNRSQSDGYKPNNLFYQLGVMGGFGNQRIHTLHTWNYFEDIPLDEKRFGLFTGIRAGIGYRYNFKNKAYINFIPVAIAAGYIDIRSTWEYGRPRNGFELLNVNLFDFSYAIPLN